ncbi:uncharacterized protein LOC124998111 [Mugil cephalus]|uniref:uncharacterized protein LOC124998111 n=1 Tax=Mugil cephalus TaxID=48193 RepID=UPI001FB8252D|nr:uncharacterized protein LOC124998111 [Mugil cephalus]
MDGEISAPCPHCRNKARRSRPRHLHKSTLSFGDAPSIYTTTHTQSFSGRSADGRPLIFQLREPSFPSQHQSQLDLGYNITQLQSVLLSHSKEVHGPKHVTLRTDPRLENWARYRSRQTAREITNPQDSSETSTTYKTEHTVPVTDTSPQQASGKPTRWHQHNILTGEQKQTAGKPSRRSRNKALWASRSRETDCCALRLY